MIHNYLYQNMKVLTNLRLFFNRVLDLSSVHFIWSKLLPFTSGRFQTLNLKMMSRVFYHCATTAACHSSETLKCPMKFIHAATILINELLITSFCEVDWPCHWKRISCKQSARWQHLSRLKASALFFLQKNLVSCMKCNNL